MIAGLVDGADVGTLDRILPVRPYGLRRAGRRGVRQLRRDVLAVRHRPASRPAEAGVAMFRTKFANINIGSRTVSKTFALDPLHSALGDLARIHRSQLSHPHSLLELPPRRGAAEPACRSRRSRCHCRQRPISIYEAGGGSTSFLPLDVLRRAAVTVVDIDEDQSATTTYAEEAILGDIQTYRFATDSFRSRDLLQRDRASARCRCRAAGFPRRR